ncbi:hypothetical protein QZM35_22705 [Burkholderia sp. AU45274]|uniref:hypothetical protein n=1 Tax=Burkholderia sp. AU45274 TaxID=3059205 RepID=UPI00264D803B|nr:hypothetical protein [Burkholderia sp. AU45274]MDN7490526.1 hypothetical protein [Burkholderia sp. AU45274]
MKTTDNNRAAVRVCAIADIECSRNCGTGACEREARYSVEQHEAAPAGVDALTDQQLIDMWSAGNRAILNGAGSRSAATAMRVAVGTSAAPLEGTGNGADADKLDRPARVGGRNYAAGALKQQVVGRAYAEYDRWLTRAPRTEVAGAVPIQAGFLTDDRKSEIARKCEVECHASPGTNMWQCAYMAIEETINALAEPHLSTWIAEVCEDADGYKHIEPVIEDLDDLPKGMRLYGAPQPPAPASAILEQIAAQWDGCMFRDIDDIDIGAAIRDAWKRLAGSAAPASAHVGLTEVQRKAIEWAIGMASQHNIHRSPLCDLLDGAKQ